MARTTVPNELVAVNAIQGTLIDKPDDGKEYTWDEETTNWVEIEE